MPQTPGPIAGRSGDRLLLVGTTKGAFILHCTPGSDRWEMQGPHFPGEEVYALAVDQRGERPVFWAAPGNPFFGVTLRRSDDLGGSWTGGEEHPVRFPEDSGLSLNRIWQIRLGRPDDPDHLLLGVEPSALFESRDRGKSWSAVAGLLNHEHRSRWTPGAGGLCLHTIVPDPTSPERTLVAMSTGGVYRSDDGGESWHPRNVGVRAEFLPDKHPEFGQCVHKVAAAAGGTGRLYLQNHWGLYRSDNWGDSWEDVARGVPSDFGFALAAHPRDPDMAYVIPLESDGFRCTPDARLRVYRTRDGGGSWQPLTRGLPQQGAYETVLRDGMDMDEGEPAGIHFGTRSGKLYSSVNEGESWNLVRDGLPPIVCVRAARLA